MFFFMKSESNILCAVVFHRLSIFGKYNAVCPIMHIEHYTHYLYGVAIGEQLTNFMFTIEKNNNTRTVKAESS